MYMYTCIYRYACMYVCIYIYIHIYIYMMHTFLYIYIYIYTHIHTCVYIYIYIHTCIHIYIHTLPRPEVRERAEGVAVQPPLRKVPYYNIIHIQMQLCLLYHIIVSYYIMLCIYIYIERERERERLWFIVLLLHYFIVKC